MRLDLRDVILVPDAEKSFQCQVDLSDLEFYGRKPIVRPVLAQGSVVNHAGRSGPERNGPLGAGFGL